MLDHKCGQEKISFHGFPILTILCFVKTSWSLYMYIYISISIYINNILIIYTYIYLCCAFAPICSQATMASTDRRHLRWIMRERRVMPQDSTHPCQQQKTWEGYHFGNSWDIVRCLIWYSNYDYESIYDTIWYNIVKLYIFLLRSHSKTLINKI